MIGTMVDTLHRAVSRLSVEDKIGQISTFNSALLTLSSTVQFYASTVRAKTAPGANVYYRLIPAGVKRQYFDTALQRELSKNHQVRNSELLISMIASFVVDRQPFLKSADHQGIKAVLFQCQISGHTTWNQILHQYQVV